MSETTTATPPTPATDEAEKKRLSREMEAATHPRKPWPASLGGPFGGDYAAGFMNECWGMNDDVITERAQEVPADDPPAFDPVAWLHDMGDDADTIGLVTEERRAVQFELDVRSRVREIKVRAEAQRRLDEEEEARVVRSVRDSLRYGIAGAARARKLQAAVMSETIPSLGAYGVPAGAQGVYSSGRLAGLNQPQATQRARTWAERASVDNIEVLRTLVRSLLTEMQTLRAMVGALDHHTHGPDGRVLIPAYEARTYANQVNGTFDPLA
jgi:hypothetical protein